MATSVFLGFTSPVQLLFLMDTPTQTPEDPARLGPKEKAFIVPKKRVKIYSKDEETQGVL